MTVTYYKLVDLMPGWMYETLAEALGVSHRDALQYLTDPDACISAFWVGKLWSIERVRRALGMDWES
jgi:hypothetical protein